MHLARVRSDWLREVDPAGIQWVDVVPSDDVGGDPLPPISLAVKELTPGGVLGIRHCWEPPPLYDSWSKMQLDWFAQQVGDSEWYVFVHRPTSVSTYPTKDVVGAEIANLPGPGLVPRLQVLAEQVAQGQTLEVTGLGEECFAEIQDALGRQLSQDYQVVRTTQNPDKPVLRVTRQA